MDETIQIDSRTYVSATSSRVDNRTRVLKKNDTFAVFDWNGEIGQVGTGSLGLYCSGTRHLARWEITLDGCRPIPLNSTIREDNSVLLVDQTTPDIFIDDQPILVKGTLHVRRELTVLDDVMQEILTVTNYADSPVGVKLEYKFKADYVDIFEVRGVVRPKRGQLKDPIIGDDSITLGYIGLDKKSRETEIKFSHPADSISDGVAAFDLNIEPGEQYILTSSIACTAPKHAQPVIKQSTESFDTATITTDNDQFNEWIARSTADLRMLTTQTSHGAYPYAGVPWFATPFGRDAIITALQTLWLQPALSKGVLAFLAATQATTVDITNEAQPGKILHECREGEMADLDEIPFRRYYGTVDATPLFIILAGRYYLRTKDLDFIQSIWSNIIAAIGWIEKYGDVDDDGFLEYARSTDRGLVQQGWKDSSDSIFHSDGSDAKMPIALSEVQAYVYEAYELAAMLAKVIGETDLATEWEKRSQTLKENFDEKFWDDELGTYVIALDGDKKPCRIRSSNAGHVLYSGMAKPERAQRLAESLTSVKAFNGWGLRTVYHGEARYNPMSYHNGSVWPHDTAMAAFGLARYGFKDQAMLYLTGLYEASNFWELSRLPELFCGFTRMPGQAPTNYPVACIPQAWAAGSSFMLLQAILGVDFGGEQPIVFRKPKLPPYIDQMKISNLAFGDNRVDIVLQRRGADVALHTENRQGSMDVSVLV